MSENFPIQNIDSSGLVIITVDTTGSIMLTLKASMQLNFNSDPWPAKMQKSNILDTHRAAVQTQTLQYRDVVLRAVRSATELQLDFALVYEPSPRGAARIRCKNIFRLLNN